MRLFLHGFVCSSPHFPEWLNISQHTGLMVATQPCHLCNSYLVWAGEIVEFLLLHQGLLWTEPWGFDKGHQSPRSPPKDKKPFSAGVQTAAGLQCGCSTSVAKGGEVYPCPPNPFWIYDLPLKASLSTREILTLLVQLYVFLKAKIRRFFLHLGKEMLPIWMLWNAAWKIHGFESSIARILSCLFQWHFHRQQLQHWPYWFTRQILSPGSFPWKLPFFLPLFRLTLIKNAGFCFVTVLRETCSGDIKVSSVPLEKGPCKWLASGAWWQCK